MILSLKYLLLLHYIIPSLSDEEKRNEIQIQIWNLLFYDGKHIVIHTQIHNHTVSDTHRVWTNWMICMNKVNEQNKHKPMAFISAFWLFNLCRSGQHNGNGNECGVSWRTKKNVCRGSNRIIETNQKHRLFYSVLNEITNLSYWLINWILIFCAKIDSFSMVYIDCVQFHVSSAPGRKWSSIFGNGSWHWITSCSSNDYK